MRNEIELRNRISDITEELENGASTGAIIEKYKVQWNAGERTIERYIALAKDIVMGRLDKRDAHIEALRGITLADQLESMRSMNELEAKLVDIIEGRYESEKVITKTGDGSTIIKSKPTVSEVIRSISKIMERKDASTFRRKGNKEENSPGMQLVVKTLEEKELVEKIKAMP